MGWLVCSGLGSRVCPGAGAQNVVGGVRSLGGLGTVGFGFEWVRRGVRTRCSGCVTWLAMWSACRSKPCLSQHRDARTKQAYLVITDICAAGVLVGIDALAGLAVSL